MSQTNNSERTTGSLHRACSACSFYNSETSECRRNPPTVAGASGGILTAIGGLIWGGTHVAWPDVEEDDWCGEFQSTPNDQAHPTAAEREVERNQTKQI